MPDRDWRASPPPGGPYERTELSTAVSEILDEARTILPGVQAFVGFQLVAVFNATFWERLGDGERAMHLVAILLNVVAMALLMTPPPITGNVSRATTRRGWSGSRLGCSPRRAFH